MRVASNTLYNLSTSRLNRVKYDLLETNTRVATGRKVNTLSDDPVSVAPILNLKSSIASVEQYTVNIATGRQWLEGGETALSSVKDLITEAKVTSISMLNGIVTTEDYTSGARVIEGIREHLLTLANTQVNGQYIFSGTKTNIRSFDPDDPDNPSKMIYQGGDNMFGIKMAEISKIDVGYSGNDVFQTPYIIIDETNNKIDFREDPTGGALEYGAELTAEIPVGKYSPQELAVTLESLMTARSAAAGQPEILNVSQNDAKFVVNNYSALTVPTGGARIDLTYTAATNSWAILNDPGYVPLISYNTLTGDASSLNLDFSGDSETDVTVTFDNPVPDGYTVSFDISAAAAGGNDVDYSVNYNEGTKKFTIMERGVPALDNLELMWATGSNSAASIGMDMGFDASSDLTGPADGVTHASDDEVEWGVFRTLIELQGFLEQGNADGINRSIARLSADFDYIGSIVSQIGIKGNRLDVRDNIIYDLNISYQTTKMRLEDADMITEITKLDQKQFAYNAAMSATAKIINMSLLDYL
ncbi:MAG: flagellar hook-associated protein FlgL [Proteobacteria bacterium]|nr:flagellar hook-associated protein FlgL [Pseudomonadota bacterium]